MRRIFPAWLGCVAWVAVQGAAGAAGAQPPSERPVRLAPSATPAPVASPEHAAWASGPYEGVVPGAGNPPPRAGAARAAGARLLTWPGFQARADGASRVFLQLSAPVGFKVQRTPGRVVLRLKGARVHLRNTRLPLETRFFNTPVVRADVEAGRGELRLVIDLRADVGPRVYEAPGEGGFHYLFVEFPPGVYSPAESRARTPSAAP